MIMGLNTMTCTGYGKRHLPLDIIGDGPSYKAKACLIIKNNIFYFTENTKIKKLGANCKHLQIKRKNR